MNIYITYDYELFFGENSGTAEKCILQPTQNLIELGEKTGAKFTFFIDIGYIIKLKEFKEGSKSLQTDYEKVVQQIQDLIRKGHACELHIHPHWEDSYYSDGKWIMKTDRYKLADFSNEAAIEIIRRYKHELDAITNVPSSIFRAGGWCLQPFKPYSETFKSLGLVLDSTVFKNGNYEKGNYYYDFRNTPDKEYWTIKDNLCEENAEGGLLELPISSTKYSPFFFWKLFLLGRLKPEDHKPIGDGYPMTSPGLRKEMLTKGKLLCGSVDGYFVQGLEPILKSYQKKKWNNLVFIGHPKANTKFAIKKLEKFISKYQNQHSFVTLPKALELNEINFQ